MTTVPPRPLQAISSGDIVSKYVDIRNARDAYRADVKKAEAVFAQQLAFLEAELNARMNADGTTSISTPDATVYYVQDTRPKCNDWGAFYRFAETSGRADLLQKRLGKAAIEAYMEDNDGALPPGVTMDEFRDVRVRKS